MINIYVVVEGGCVRYVSSEATELAVVVVDLDDYDDEPTPQVKSDMEAAEALPRIW